MRRDPDHVYFARITNARAHGRVSALPDGAIKIGVAAEPLVRMRGLKRDKKFDAELLCHFAGYISAEQRTHRVFDFANIRGEYFEPHPDLLTTISVLRGETALDEAPLPPSIVEFCRVHATLERMRTDLRALRCELPIDHEFRPVLIDAAAALTMAIHDLERGR